MCSQEELGILRRKLYRRAHYEVSAKEYLNAKKINTDKGKV